MTKLCPGEFFIDLKYFNFSNLIYFISVLYYEGAKQKGNDTMNYESELVIRAKNGDANALNLLLDHNKSYIYAIAFALLKNHEDAEDAVQKTMITVWQSIGSLESPEAFKSWLYRIAHTRSLNVLQSKKNNQVILDDDISDMPQLENMESEMMLPQAYAERDDLRDRLYLIIDGLSAVQRETIVLYYFNDRSVAEIAEIMDCSDNTVKSRLYLARHSIKTEIEEQERKSGEKFYGIAVGALPIGYFVAEHVKHSLPPAEVLGNLVTTAQQAGQSAAQQVTGKTAAKGMPTAVKAILATVGIAAIAVTGIMTAKLIFDSQNKDYPTPIETQVITAETAAETEAPTEPDYTDAYRAYLEVLEDNKDLIKAYDWQMNQLLTESDKDSKPIVFADIAGDSTPEMIVAGCFDNEDTTKSYAFLRIYQYNNGATEQVYSQSRDDQMKFLDYTIAKGVGGPFSNTYALFQRPGEKTLYLYAFGSNGTYNTYSLIRSYEESSGDIQSRTNVYCSEDLLPPGVNVSSENVFTIDGGNASKSECLDKIEEITSDSVNLLMYCQATRGQDIYNSLISRHDNQAMTYDEAVSYLKEQIGDSSNSQDNDQPKEDYSVIAGSYGTSFVRHYNSSLTIDSNGVFETDFYYDPSGTRGQGVNGDPAEYSLCRGRIVIFKKTGDYTYTFNIADISYVYPVGESGDITYTDAYTHTNKSMHANFVKHPFDTEGTMTFYAKGITPTDMKESHFKSYVFPDNPKTSERAQTPTSYNIIYIPYGSADNPYYGK